MGRLFWKVALAIAVPQALVLSLLFLNTNALYRGFRPWWLEPTSEAMPLFLDSAIAAHEMHGPVELRRVLDRISLSDHFTYWLLDEHLRELSGRPLPQPIAELIQHP